MSHRHNHGSAFRRAYFGLVVAGMLIVSLAAAPVAAAGFRIDNPKDGAVISDVAGNLSVDTEFEQTDLVPRMRFRALLDGKPVTPLSYVPVFRLRDIPSGRHELQVEILDPDGNVIERSDPVKFEMRRESDAPRISREGSLSRTGFA